MLDRILDKESLATSISIGDRLPIIADPIPRLPVLGSAPKLNSAAELKITRDGLDFKVAVSLDMGR